MLSKNPEKKCPLIFGRFYTTCKKWAKKPCIETTHSVLSDLNLYFFRLIPCKLIYYKCVYYLSKMERETRFELATYTLARYRSTN